MKAPAVCAAIAVSLASCGKIGASPYEEAVKRELRDPESAQFTEVETGDGVACGFVNSKNGYGGYGGRVGFVVRGSEPDLAQVTMLDELKAEHVQLVASTCPAKVEWQIQRWMIDRNLEVLKEASGEL